MLKIPNHQVAGHQAGAGKLGPLIDDSGRFYKPLQGDERGSHEVAFYTSFSSNPRVPDHIRKYFPIFYGTQLIDASDGSGLQSHLVLEDLASSRLNPSIMDIKIGSRTWAPQSPEVYIEKCLKKDRETSSILLGFRISGLQIYGKSKGSGYWKPDRKSVQNLIADEARLVLKKFISSNPKLETDPDCHFASTVYGSSTGILTQLMELKSWFEDQTLFHFYACSILMMYDENKEGVVVKLIDFAHVIEGGGVIDHNFLGGLCSLIKFISEILAATPGKCKTEARPNDLGLSSNNGTI